MATTEHTPTKYYLPEGKSYVWECTRVSVPPDEYDESDADAAYMHGVDVALAAVEYFGLEIKVEHSSDKTTFALKHPDIDDD